SVLTQPWCQRLAHFVHVLRQVLHHPRWQCRTPSVDDVGQVLQEGRNISRLTVKERYDPHHGKRDEQRHPQCQDGDCDKLPLPLTYPHNPQPRRQDVHELVDQKSCQERRQQMQQQNEDQCPTGEEPGGDIIGKDCSTVVRCSHEAKDSKSRGDVNGCWESVIALGPL